MTNLDRLIEDMQKSAYEWLEEYSSFAFEDISKEYFKFKDAHKELFGKGVKIETPIKEHLENIARLLCSEDSAGHYVHHFWTAFAHLEDEQRFGQGLGRLVWIKQNEHKGIVFIFIAYLYWASDSRIYNQIPPKVFMHYMGRQRMLHKQKKQQAIRLAIKKHPQDELQLHLCQELSILGGGSIHDGVQYWLNRDLGPLPKQFLYF